MSKASELAEGANQLYTSMEEDTRMRVDMHAAFLFGALECVGLLPHWPSTIHDLSAEQMGVLRHLIIQMTPLISSPTNTVNEQQEEESCPHAAPHTYCQSCAVSPCPLGLEPND